MFGPFKKKKVQLPAPRLNLSSANSYQSLPSRLVTGHGEWNAALEDVLYERLDKLGVPLVYHKDGANTPSKETSDQYGHNSIMGRNALDEGILLRKMGCKHLYPRFLAIFAKMPVFIITRPANRSPYLTRRSDDVVDYIATFSSVSRANEGTKVEAPEYTEVIEVTGEALLRRFPNHGVLLNPGSPGATFAVPPEVTDELRRALGF